MCRLAAFVKAHCRLGSRDFYLCGNRRLLLRQAAAATSAMGLPIPFATHSSTTLQAGAIESQHGTLTVLGPSKGNC